LLLTLFHLAIGQRKDESIHRPKPDEVVKGTIPSPDSLLFDISVQSFAMGRTTKFPLYFRLYKSGRLEYEVEQKSDSATGIAGVVYVKKETQLSASVVEELIRLAEEPDFLNAPGSYASLTPVRDASRSTIIVYSNSARGREKRIVIRDYNPRHPRAESSYPKSLVKLLGRVSELRPKD